MVFAECRPPCLRSTRPGLVLHAMIAHAAVRRCLRARRGRTSAGRSTSQRSRPGLTNGSTLCGPGGRWSRSTSRPSPRSTCCAPGPERSPTPDDPDDLLARRDPGRQPVDDRAGAAAHGNGDHALAGRQGDRRLAPDVADGVARAPPPGPSPVTRFARSLDRWSDPRRCGACSRRYNAIDTRFRARRRIAFRSGVDGVCRCR